MPKNSESLNRTLFDLLHSKGYDPTLLDTSGKEIPTPEEAEVFQFNFVKDGEDYGKVTMSIDGAHKLIIYFSDKVADSEKEESDSGDLSWYKLLNQLKRFAQSYQLSFELRNVDNLKHDMAKREYMKKKESIQEGYHPMGKKASYSDSVPNVKMIIQHSRQIEEGEQRYRNVERIFLENEQGERFLAPTTKPGVARVYARHIAEGGNPHDERWNHIGSLVEEYQKMGAFVRATRNGQFNESAQQLVNEGINHYQSLRETLGKMTGHRGYNSYFESYTPPLMEDENSVDLSEMFMSSSLDPRIESVMPILAKLSKNLNEMSEVSELSEWADSLLEGGDGGEASEEKDGSTDGDAGEGGAEDAPMDDLNEEESLTSNNPQGVPEGIVDTIKKVGGKVLDKLGHGSDDDLLKDLQKKAGIPAQHGKPAMAKSNEEEVDESALQAYLGDKKYGKEGMDALRQAGREHASKEKMAQIRDKFDKLDEVGDTPAGLAAVQKVGKRADRALGDAGTGYSGSEIDNIDKTYAARDRANSIVNRERIRANDKKSTMDEGDVTKTPTGLTHKATDKYGAGEEHTQGERKVAMDLDHLNKQQIKNFDDSMGIKWKKEGPKGIKVDEDEFAGDYATGEAGQWRNKGPKANKPATIGDFVGESQLDEMDKSDDVKGPEGKATPITPKKMADDAKKVLDKEKVKEGQEDLDTIKRLLGK